MNIEIEQTLHLNPRATQGAIAAEDISGEWRLEIPPGPAGTYRLAQIDDYAQLSRNAFPWKAPCRLSLIARASRPEALLGTWGFGFWNDPFSLALGLGVGSRRLPAMPNAAWFFFASPPNYLSLRDDLPAVGKLAATFSSPSWHPALLAIIATLLPLAAIPALARRLRRRARRLIQQDAVQLKINQADWHRYQIDWRAEGVGFSVDSETVLQTPIAPLGPLGLVLWVDNQYAAFQPDGRLRYGTLENSGNTYIEIKQIVLSTPG